MSTSRRQFLATVAAAGAARSAPARRRPNIVLFMTDDHGAWATGAYGCTDLVTPEIDALARGGVKFTRAYACTPVCSPSRATYLTGQIPSNHGLQDYLIPEDSFGPKARRWLEGMLTYPDVLAQAGYTCAMTGKWHLGEDEKAQHGFTYWATVPGGGGTFGNATFVNNGETKKVPGFKEDGIGDFAIDFLDRHDGKTPFYLHVPFYAPHRPFDFLTEQDRKPYLEHEPGCYPHEPVHPNQNPSMGVLHKDPEATRGYSALITGADRVMGRILRKIEQKGWREDTLVIFTADQGWNAGHHGVWGKGNGTWPFNALEESIRVPMIWHQPSRLKAGTVATGLISSYDLFPTLLEYAGVPAPAASPKRPGRSYLPMLEGRSMPERPIFIEYAHLRGVRTGRYKLILRTKEFPSELFDLEKDPGEKENRFDDPALAKVKATLTRQLEGFFAAQGAPPLEEWRKTTRQQLYTYKPPARP